MLVEVAVALHTPRTVFSPRHAPSFLLLALSAGAVNAGAFLACERFVTHVTGTSTQLGLDVGQWWLVVDYAIVLACFIAGAMTSALAIEGRHHRGRRPLHAAPLLTVAVLLAAVALAGDAGVFGPFGGTVEEPADFLLLSVLSFAMGLQNAAVATCTGMLVRTTHMTGPATDLGVHLATGLFTTGETRRTALANAALRAGKIASFVAGAVVMLPVVHSFGYVAFLVPAAIVAAATAASFVPAWVTAGARPVQPAH
jgi:uncharacterized membrane protein YoaK (UPF0700 family)